MVPSEQPESVELSTRTVQAVLPILPSHLGEAQGWRAKHGGHMVINLHLETPLSSDSS
jgi:hypothetical protein